LVFLHHEQFVCDLPPNSKINLYGLDGRAGITKLPGISKVLLAPARHDLISELDSRLIAGLMKAIGLAPRRQREVGSWIIDDQPLADGDGWQDWPAFHPSRRRSILCTRNAARTRHPTGRRTSGSSSSTVPSGCIRQLCTHGIRSLPRPFVCTASTL
jgi:hypothetical protein